MKVLFLMTRYLPFIDVTLVLYCTSKRPPFISDTQEPIYSTNHGQTNSSRTSALRPVIQPTFPQDVRTFSASPHSPIPRAHILFDGHYIEIDVSVFFSLSLFGVDRVYRVWYHSCRKSVPFPVLVFLAGNLRLASRKTDLLFV